MKHADTRDRAGREGSTALVSPAGELSRRLGSMDVHREEREPPLQPMAANSSPGNLWTEQLSKSGKSDWFVLQALFLSQVPL